MATVVSGLVLGLLSLPFFPFFIRAVRAQRGHRIRLVCTSLIFSVLAVLYQLIFDAHLHILGLLFRNVAVFGAHLNLAQIVANVLAVLISVGLDLVAWLTMAGKTAHVASRPLGAGLVGVPLDRIYAVVFTLGAKRSSGCIGATNMARVVNALAAARSADGAKVVAATLTMSFADPTRSLYPCYMTPGGVKLDQDNTEVVHAVRPGRAGRQPWVDLTNTALAGLANLTPSAG